MADQILEWLERAHHPGDIYELLGKQRFDPNVAGLQSAVANATREIMPYQGHSDSGKAQRAMRLLTDLGGADTVLADPEKLKKHDVQILDYLFDEYAADHGQDPQKWDQKQLTTWLKKSWDVHLDSLQNVVEQLCPATPEASNTGATSQSGRKQSGPQQRRRQAGRKRKSGGRRQRDDGPMFEDAGMESRSTARRQGGRRPQTGTRRSGRKRASNQTPLLAYTIAGCGILTVMIAAFIFWPKGDRSGECVLIVDPPEAKVKVDREDVTVRSKDDRRSVVISNAEVVKENEPVVISIESQGYHPREIRWTPQVGQSSEIKVQLYRDFDDK